MPPLHEWETFYVIIGSSAAALTGLQFVVIALSADTRRIGGEPEMQAFGTPTIVHFCGVLLISAFLSTPGQTAATLSLCITIMGALGLGYAILIAYRAQRTTGYRPVLEDWIWHVGLPLFAYTVLLIVGIEIRHHPVPSLYLVAATALVMLFIGIHNAWDAAIYMALTAKEDWEQERKQEKEDADLGLS